ncbi:MAG: GNAT family N-acetyltransferase [bacterium]|nr:GNAT family N-acetyltransferase [bacterium]
MADESSRIARPVYHCSLCNRPLTWDDGRLRLVCKDPECHGDRPRPAPIQVREGDEHDRIALLDQSRRFFGSSHLHAFGEVFPLAKTPFLVVEFADERAGYLAYALHFPRQEDASVVLMAVRPEFQGRGVGRALQGAFEAVCRPLEITRLHICTTNDNIPGLYFYQRCGYRLMKISPDVAAEALIEHGDSGMVGFGGIPIMDEIHLTKDLKRVVESLDPAAGPEVVND